jgi:iron complex transport system substrate-binding protein
MRVVSLLPSATEIVGALGALEHLVGVTHECDHPAVVASRPRVTRSAVDGAAAPAAVDAQVRSLAHAGTPLYTIDTRRLRDLHPDLILTQALCEVCAVSEDEVRAVAATLAPPPAVLSLSPRTLDEVFADIARVGAALGVPDEADELVRGLHARLRRVHDTLKAAVAPRPRVAVLEWTDPVFFGGHWVPEMVRKAGGTDVLAAPGDHSAVRSVDEVRGADPAVVVVAPCGYDLPRAVAAARALRADARWRWLEGRAVWALDANAFASRPGPRLVEGVEVLARILHPALFTPLDVTHAVEVPA